MPPTNLDMRWKMSTPIVNPYLTEKSTTYGDWWDTRGKDGLSDILHKWIHGWLGIDQIKIITASGDFWLNQREIESDGIKLLIIHFGI